MKMGAGQRGGLRRGVYRPRETEFQMQPRVGECGQGTPEPGVTGWGQECRGGGSGHLQGSDPWGQGVVGAALGSQGEAGSPGRCHP